MMNFAWIGLILLIMCESIFAKSLGLVGAVFPVAEKSFLTLIEERLHILESNGTFEELNRRWIQTVAEHANRPPALGLRRALQTKNHHYFPEITLSEDILDNKGNVLYHKGTHVNALTHLSWYQPCWLFFNAEDEAQLRWAEQQKKLCSNPKFILTGGEIRSTEIRLQEPIYFDQAGRITLKLKISSVPARVTRGKDHLRIVESVIKENGHVL
jgi:conjugal transfer pilus assembly protein TraW